MRFEWSDGLASDMLEIDSFFVFFVAVFLVGAFFDLSALKAEPKAGIDFS